MKYDAKSFAFSSSDFQSTPFSLNMDPIFLAPVAHSHSYKVTYGSLHGTFSLHSAGLASLILCLVFYLRSEGISECVFFIGRSKIFLLCAQVFPFALGGGTIF